MPAAPTPKPLHSHSPAFLAALGLPEDQHPKGLRAQCADYPASYLIGAMAFELSLESNGIADGERLPAWVNNPGSAEGLAALRAIMEALGYSLIGSYWCSGPATLMIADSHFSFAYGPGIPGSSFGVIAKWTDPTALPRLLHLALALAPEAPHA